MATAKVHIVGKYTGTCVELAAITQIAVANFGRRLKKFYAGHYTAAQCMTIGPLSKTRVPGQGNAALRALSSKTKDARQTLANIPLNWLHKGAHHGSLRR